MNARENPKTLKEALTMCQEMNVTAIKNKKNDYFKSTYSDLTSVISAANHGAEFGLSFTQLLEYKNIILERIKTENGKIIVDNYYKTNINGYYAIGDVLPNQALAHVASAEGITCVEKIAGHSPDPIDYGNIPGCTYSTPEIASVGMTEAAAKEAGHEIKVGKFPFTASGKASAAGHKDGFVKVIVDAKYGEWLGCHMIGYNVTEMIAEIVAIRKLETTGEELIKTIHPHPTMSEAVMEAAAAAYGEVIHL